jgi:hypothetical protein
LLQTRAASINCTGLTVLAIKAGDGGGRSLCTLRGASYAAANPRRSRTEGLGDTPRHAVDILPQDTPLPRRVHGCSELDVIQPQGAEWPLAPVAGGRHLTCGRGVRRLLVRSDQGTVLGHDCDQVPRLLTVPRTEEARPHLRRGDVVRWASRDLTGRPAKDDRLAVARARATRDVRQGSFSAGWAAGVPAAAAPSAANKYAVTAAAVVTRLRPVPGPIQRLPARHATTLISEQPAMAGDRPELWSERMAKRSRLAGRTGTARAARGRPPGTADRPHQGCRRRCYSAGERRGRGEPGCCRTGGGGGRCEGQGRGEGSCSSGGSAGGCAEGCRGGGGSRRG